MQVAAPGHGATAPRRLPPDVHVGPIKRVGPLAGVVRRLFATGTGQVESAWFRETIPLGEAHPPGIQQVEAAMQSCVCCVR